MELRPKIRRVVLENYKSIAFCDVTLGPLTILVGPNGAGKSNFLDAIRFLSEAMNMPFRKSSLARSNLVDLFRRGPNVKHMGIRIDFITSAGPGHFSVRFESGNGTVQREQCVIDGTRPDSYEILEGQLKGPRNPNPFYDGNYLYLPGLTGQSGFSELVRMLECSRFYNFTLADMRKEGLIGPEAPILDSGGANLSEVLQHIWLQHPNVLQRIDEYLGAINPAFDHTRSKQGGLTCSPEFTIGNNGAWFSVRQVSDGTLRSLAVLIALFQRASERDRVALVGIEEPEAGLHPAAAGVLFDALNEASGSVQVIATSHSADLLDRKDVDTGAILAVEMENGATRIGPVDEIGRGALKDRLYTAGELMRMNHLRPESGQSPGDSEIESILFQNPVPA